MSTPTVGEGETIVKFQQPMGRFHSLLHAVLNAANNEIVPTDKKGELVSIALKAMKTKHEDRHASALGFQEAIREYETHAESLVLSQEAQEDLDRAARSKDYDDYGQSIFGYQQALKLWEENKQAKAGLRTARTAPTTTTSLSLTTGICCSGSVMLWRMLSSPYGQRLDALADFLLATPGAVSLFKKSHRRPVILIIMLGCG